MTSSWWVITGRRAFDLEFLILGKDTDSTTWWRSRAIWKFSKIWLFLTTMCSNHLETSNNSSTPSRGQIAIKKNLEVATTKIERPKMSPKSKIFLKTTVILSPGRNLVIPLGTWLLKWAVKFENCAGKKKNQNYIFWVSFW